MDEKGRPLKLLLSQGNSHDISSAPQLLEGMELANCFVLGDKGYDSMDFVLQIENAQGTAVIPSRATNRIQREYDKELYKCRNLVEKFFNRMKQFLRNSSPQIEKLPIAFCAGLFYNSRVRGCSPAG